MRASTPRAVADVLASAIPELRDRLAVEQMRRVWSRLVGVEIAGHARPRRLLGSGELQIVVDNSPWLQELTLRAPDLLVRIAARFPQVRALGFRLGTLPPERSDTGEGQRRRLQPLDPDAAREIDVAVAAIPDAGLRAAARRLLTKARQAPLRGTVALVVATARAAGCATVGGDTAAADVELRERAPVAQGKAAEAYYYYSLGQLHAHLAP